MSTTEALVLQLELARVDCALASAEYERNDLELRWARAPAGTTRERAQLAMLHRLDQQIAQLAARRHRLVCDIAGERHLKAIPASGAKEKRHG